MTEFLSKNRYGLALIAICLGALGIVSAASAAPIVAVTRSQPANTSFAIAEATANYANSTVTASDITAATVTVPASKTKGATEYYRACFWADAGKATSTTGTISLVVNGSTVTAASRVFNTAAVRGSVSNCFVGARPTTASFIVKLQGVSGDTAAFTVYNAQLLVETFRLN